MGIWQGSVTCAKCYENIIEIYAHKGQIDTSVYYDQHERVAERDLGAIFVAGA